MYNWQQKNWTKFSYNLAMQSASLKTFSEESAYMAGMFEIMPDDAQTETILQVMLAEAIKTSAIEGEVLSRPDVLSSIRNKMGLDNKAGKIKDQRAQGIGELIVVVRNSFMAPLTEKMLLNWHFILMKKNKQINAGVWRRNQEPMQVVSGTIGKEKVHFEAPLSKVVPAGMKKFIKWFNDTAPGGKSEIREAPVRAAIVHLYFESIHPFDDGNGRIGRALAEKALAQTSGRHLLLSLSQIIESNKKTYYKALEKAQRNNEITEWINYFINVIIEAQHRAKKLIAFTLKKMSFFDRHQDHLNEREIKVIKRMLDEGPEGFAGGMTAKKYMAITKTSKATATRDLQHLTDLKIFIPAGGGRNVHYSFDVFA